MRYVTESLADALYQARMARLSESTETDTQKTEAKEITEEVNESTVSEDEEDLDYTDVDDTESEADDEEEVDKALDLDEGAEEVDEARWVTMKNKNHALIDDDGSVLAGGDPKTRKKASRKEIEAAAKDAGSK